MGEFLSVATVAGYPNRTSVPVGGDIDFHLSASDGIPGNRVLTVGRVRPVGGPTATTSLTVGVPVQPVPATDAWEGYGWDPTVTFTVPSGWVSGLYQVDEAGEVLFDFVVLAAVPGATSAILFQVGTHTPQAYWAQGGRSFYTEPRAPRVSYDRPGAQYRQGVPFLDWLEGEGLAVELCASHDLHRTPDLLDSYALLLVVEHDEYWSRQMRDAVDSFVGNGGNVAVFSGNTCYRQVRLEGDREHLMVCYKDPGPDPIADRDQLSIAMAQPPLCHPTTLTLGAGFTHGAGCWNNTGLMAGTGFDVRFPDHWVFEGVTATRVAVDRVGYETDAVAFVEEPEGYPRVTGEDGAPPTTTVLGSADLRHWGPGGKPGMATIGLLTRNGTVFNAASISWQEGLAGDPAVRRVTRNVVNRLRTRRTWDVWERIGNATDVTAMTALDSRLWCTTQDNRLLRRFPMGANAPWTPVGHANDVRSLAGAAGRLWAVTGDNRLWRRPPAEQDISWETVGTGPAGGTLALAGTTFLLYAVDTAGKIWMAPAVAPVAWQEIPTMASVRQPAIRAMTAYEDVLFAATSDAQLVRTRPDIVYEGNNQWLRVHHCNFATGLAAVDSMLFTSTTEDLLWWLDLRGLKAP